MGKYILILLAFILMSSCFSSRNQYKALRIPLWRFSVKPSVSSDIYSLIDTTALYFNVRVNGEDSLDHGRGKLVAVTESQNSLKFYANGRVAQFWAVDFQKPQSLNPARGRMGMYGTWGKKEGFYVEEVSQSPQAGVFLLKDKITAKGDTLYLDNGQYNYMYIKRKIPAELLIFKPDW